MKIPSLQEIFREARAAFSNDSDPFLERISGLIHVGANVGQERNLYRRRGLRVVWVEPIPDIFETLQANIRNCPDQVALQALLTDQDDAEYAFHVANNRGASSSIFEFKLHKDIWPDVEYDRTITLRSTTLPSLLTREHIDAGDYDALVLDTQGSELLVLQGAVPILREFRFIKTEAPDFESYEGGCGLDDIRSFLKPYGFFEISRHRFARRLEGGSYYDVVFERGT